MIAMLHLMPRDVLRGFRTSVLMKSLLAGASMAAVVYLLRLSSSLWIVAACVGSLLYVGMLFAMKTFEPSEDAFFRKVLQERLHLPLGPE
jgi:uncharacterized membrane protein YoaK (UPF0700 family)